MHVAYRRALAQAPLSTHGKKKMAAVIWKNGSFVIFACNGSAPGEHAERNALSKVKLKRGCVIAVARLGNRKSTPCVECLAAIVDAGIRWVIYHDGTSVIKKKPSQITPERNYALAKTKNRKHNTLESS